MSNNVNIRAYNLKMTLIQFQPSLIIQISPPPTPRPLWTSGSPLPGCGQSVSDF
jgi:hypothetical protein